MRVCLDRGVLHLLGVCLVASNAACGPVPREELTTQNPYSDLVGAEFRVVANDVVAYGIYGNWPERVVTYVTPIPGPGIGGYEVAFRRQIPKGTTFRIVGVWRISYPFRPVFALSVELHGSDLSVAVPVEIDLSRGNEAGPTLNPNVYEQIHKRGESSVS